MTIEGLIAILIAPVIGSFLGTVVNRLPEGRSVTFGRSACDHCGKTLSPAELVPIIAYLRQRGRCGTCGGELGTFYPLIELAALAVASSAALVLSGWLLAVSLYLGWSLLTLAFIDARHKILPDPINLPLIPVGLTVTWLHSPTEIQAHVIGAALGFTSLAAVAWVYRQVRHRDGLGLGDAKLLAAAGAWLGFAPLPGLLVVAALTALFVTLACKLFGDRLGPAEEIAFGPYLALSFWASWLLGPIIFF